MSKNKEPGHCAASCNAQCSLAQDVYELKAMVKAQNKRLNKLIRHVEDGCKEVVEDAKESTVICHNPYLKCLNPDVLYHLGLDTKTTDFPKTFGDVRFVCMGGTAQRMEKFAYYIMKEIGLKMHAGAKLKDLAEDGHRYALYKVGPVLCASHGIGGPSISILLHEIIKMMHHAKCQDPVFFRVGTCGGIGVEGGTVVITSEALNGQSRPCHEVVVNGQPEMRCTSLDTALAKELQCLAENADEFKTVVGKTVSTNDFYEGQSRLDGAFCSITPESKARYLSSLKSSGVVNMEMESSAFAALTSAANIRAAVICVAILNRLNGDQITTPPEVLQEWEGRPQQLVARYMRKVLYPKDDDDEDFADAKDSNGCD